MARPLNGRLFYPVADVIACAALTPAAKLVWAFLRFCEHPDAPARIGVRRIAKKLCLDRKTVERALTQLREGGYLEQVEPGRLASQNRLAESAAYRTLLPPVGSVGILPTLTEGQRGQEADAGGGEKPTLASQNADAGGDKKGTPSKRDGQREEEPSSPSLRGSPGGNGDGLLALWESLRGRRASDAEAGSFRDAVAKAKEEGAPDGLVEAEIRKDSRGAPWDPATRAMARAREALAEFRRLPGLGDAGLAQVAAFLGYDPSVPDGIAMQEDLKDLREKHAGLLAEATEVAVG